MLRRVLTARVNQVERPAVPVAIPIDPMESFRDRARVRRLAGDAS